MFMDTIERRIDQAIYKRPNFPQKGILFYDISSLTADPDAFQAAVQVLIDFAKTCKATAVAGIDARGFIFSGALAQALHLPLFLVRKKGKLARECWEESYSLEYGQATICLPKEDAASGHRVLVVDDLVATGGTLKAACDLFEKHGSTIAGLGCVVGLPYAGYETVLKGYPIKTIVRGEDPHLA